MAKLTLNDEFNTLGGPWAPVFPWSPNGWATGGSWLANPSLLPPSANPISLSNGVLSLSDFERPVGVTADQTGGLDRIAGQIVTENTFAQTYGYFEARIEMPAGNGVGGAFWLLPQDGGWPPELDIAEVYGNYPSMLLTTLHDDPGDDDPQAKATTVAGNTTTDFHTYAVDWNPTTITWLFDNQPVYQIPTPADMNKPMFMVLSLNAGLPDRLEGAASPSLNTQMKIDWVHVYDSNPYPPTAPTAAAPASPDPTTITINSATLIAPTSPTTFLVSDNHDAVISNFLTSDVLDFRPTLQDFENLRVLPDGLGNSVVTLGNDRITLGGVTPDDLTWKNFLINGQSNTNPSL